MHIYTKIVLLFMVVSVLSAAIWPRDWPLIPYTKWTRFQMNLTSYAVDRNR